MPEFQEASVQAVALAIAQYLAQHPDAADTVDGIQRWWLPERLADRAPGIVAAALEGLVASGVVVSVQLPDGGTLYGASRAGGGPGGAR
jgi:hypothetical protein